MRSFFQIQKLPTRRNQKNTVVIVRMRSTKQTEKERNKQTEKETNNYFGKALELHVDFVELVL